MTALPLKPALFAGFLLLGTTLPVAAQDYVDVEAERRAAAQNPGAPQRAVAEDAAADYAGIRRSNTYLQGSRCGQESQVR